MAYVEKEMNLKRAFVEYKVTQPTTDFAITFEFVEAEQNLRVRLNGIDIEDLGYSFSVINSLTVRVTPAISRGTLRISRETDIDENLYKFTAGALFEARTMDEDFEQIRDAQQELRDEVNFISSRWTLKDTILEITASTSFPEPDMIFGAYVTARKFEIEDFFPHIARCVSDVPIVVGIYRNEEKVGDIYVSNQNSNSSTIKLTDGKQVFNRGDRLILKLDTSHYSLTQAAVTLVGKFPLYDLV